MSTTARSAGLPNRDARAYRRRMEFRVLGPLDVSARGERVPLGGPRQRVVLANLLIHAKHVVSADDLIDRIWGERAPDSARKTLQSYVTRLEWRSPGYILHLEPNELDAARFESLADRAQRIEGQPERASVLYREALQLWRGDAFADLADEPSLAGEIARLDDLRLQALEGRIAADIERGREAAVTGELESLTKEHPLRERSWGLLMLALYRCGRQGDALAAYQRARDILAEELGIDPNLDLQHLYGQILRTDPALDPKRDRLLGYELIEEVGEGRLGVVYRGRQPHLAREVAIKVIRPELANDPTFVRRFEAEGQLLARLEHASIVPLYDYWREPDAAYLVTRWMPGGTLEEALAGRTFDLATVLRLEQQLTSALAFAHSLGVVHGDLRTTNVLLDDEGNAYLTDFALADLPAAAPSSRGSDVSVAVRADVTALGDLLSGVVEAVPDHPQALRDVLRRATAREPTGGFPDAASLGRAFREALTGISGRAVNTAETANPYKGLRPFLEGDAADFFGRSVLVDRLVDRLRESIDGNRFLGVIGPSGCGKSSAVRAGLIPALRAGAIPGSDTWFFVEMMPGTDPLGELGRGLVGIATNPPEDLAEVIASEAGIPEAIDRVLPPDGSELFLVIDQLEEIFTHVEDEESRARFVEGIAAAVLAPWSRLRVVVTIRADHYDRPLAYAGFGALLAARSETVLPLAPAELELAIAGPLRRVGVPIEQALVAEIVADSAERVGVLPHLQYALTELFDHRDGLITAADYRAFGGVGGVLAGRAEQLYTSRGREEQREAIRQLFLRLVSIGDATDDLRRRVRRSELDSLEGDREAIAAAIDLFTRHRFLTSDRDPATREPTIEVAHEALLRSWPRLRRWIESARQDLRAHRELALESSAWADSGRDESFLLRGSRLARTTLWVDGSGIALNALEREYVDESVRDGEAEQAAQREREDRERFLERRSARRLRTLVAVLAVAALVASGLTVVANGQRGDAAREARVSAAHALAAAAISNIDVDPERSILLAMAAVDRTRSVDGSVLPEAVEALHRAIGASRILRSVPGGEVVDWGPDGYVTMGLRNDGTIALRDPETGEIIRSSQGPSEITDVVFSRDGSSLATTSAGGELDVWDVSTGQRVASASSKGPASGPSFDADGSTVAAAWRRRGVVEILDVASDTVTRTFGIPLAQATSLDPSGTRIAVGTGSRDCRGGGLFGIDLRSGRRTRFEGAGHCGSSFAAWSPDGRYVVGATGDCGQAQVSIWSGRSGALRYTPFGHTDCVWDVDWSSDSTRIATASYDGTSKVYEMTPGGPQQQFSLSTGRRDSVSDVAFSPDDTKVFTTAAGVGRIWDVGPEADAEVAVLRTRAPGFWLGDVGFISGGSGVVLPNGWGPAAECDIGSGHRTGRIGPSIAPFGHWDEGPAPSFDVSADGDTFAIMPGTGGVSLWDVASGKRLFSYHDEFVTGMDLSANGKYLALKYYPGVLLVLDRTGAVIHSVYPPWSGIEAIAISPDGTRVAMLIHRQVTIWDLRRDRPITQIPAQDLGPFDPSGRELVTWGDDRVPRIWSATDGRSLLTLPMLPADIYAASFSPDGGQLAVGTADRLVRVFDADTATEPITLPGAADQVTGIAFSPDGSMLAATTRYGPARIWALDIDDLLAIARQHLTRTWTEEECRMFLQLDRCPQT
jgi:WD40 repeat protein/DNA-binding SARP family transcriptional activator/tRNA A-37 threonylcarbamoyl transferase component Bud32